ncbi:hypothetical protein SETIT_3G381200v2 [Setaria italica]|uniref:Uncharacterized protein n=1 Tax=Setaria italica TaxID=4555 RepID=A0A368QN79_SETIT|nr:hypothetical protein SETIT_3G381200v2 [Setaria italica]
MVIDTELMAYLVKILTQGVKYGLNDGRGKVANHAVADHLRKKARPELHFVFYTTSWEICHLTSWITISWSRPTCWI